MQIIALTASCFATACTRYMAVLPASLQRSPCLLPRRPTTGLNAGLTPATRTAATAQQLHATSASAAACRRRSLTCSAASASPTAVPQRPLHPGFSALSKRSIRMSSNAAAAASGPSAAAAAAGAPGAGAGAGVRDTIQLTDQEREIFDTLLAAVRQAGSSTTLRCAGGWVRDKLLGRGSDDIDIALDDCLGKDFAELVNDWLKSQVRDGGLGRVVGDEMLGDEEARSRGMMS